MDWISFDIIKTISLRTALVTTSMHIALQDDESDQASTVTEGSTKTQPLNMVLSTAVNLITVPVTCFLARDSGCWICLRATENQTSVGKKLPKDVVLGASAVESSHQGYGDDSRALHVALASGANHQKLRVVATKGGNFDQLLDLQKQITAAVITKERLIVGLHSGEVIVLETGGGVLNVFKPSSHPIGEFLSNGKVLFVASGLQLTLSLAVFSLFLPFYIIECRAPTPHARGFASRFLQQLSQFTMIAV